MKPSTDDKARGKLREAKGTIKEKVGRMINNPELEADGKAEKNAGKAQNWVGQGRESYRAIRASTSSLETREATQ